MKPYLRKIDIQTTGNRYDITPLFADPEAFQELLEDLIEPFLENQEKEQKPLPHFVAGIDALGFILGTAIAQRLSLGFLPIRKANKLPVSTEPIWFQDYSGQIKGLEIRQDVLKPNHSVLLVDEWIETGAQMTAAVQLVEKQNASVAGIFSICMEKNEVTQQLRKRYSVYTVWDEPSSFKIT